MENLRDRLRARKGSEQTRNESVASVERSSRELTPRQRLLKKDYGSQTRLPETLPSLFLSFSELKGPLTPDF